MCDLLAVGKKTGAQTRCWIIINLIPPFFQQKISQEMVTNNIKLTKNKEGRQKQIT